MTHRWLLQVGAVLETLVKAFDASFLPYFDELSSYLMPMLVSGFYFFSS